MNDLKEKWKVLSAKREELVKRKTTIETTYEVRRQQLKSLEDECRQMGFNPETLSDDVKELQKKVETEMEKFEKGLEAADSQITNIESVIEAEK